MASPKSVFVSPWLGTCQMLSTGCKWRNCYISWKNDACKSLCFSVVTRFWFHTMWNVQARTSAGLYNIIRLGDIYRAPPITALFRFLNRIRKFKVELSCTFPVYFNVNYWNKIELYVIIAIFSILKWYFKNINIVLAGLYIEKQFGTW